MHRCSLNAQHTINNAIKGTYSLSAWLLLVGWLWQNWCMEKTTKDYQQIEDVSDLKAKYVQRFKEIHKQQTGQDLSDEEALGYFEDLIALVKAVYRPIPVSEARKMPKKLRETTSMDLS